MVVWSWSGSLGVHQFWKRYLLGYIKVPMLPSEENFPGQWPAPRFLQQIFLTSLHFLSQEGAWPELPLIALNIIDHLTTKCLQTAKNKIRKHALKHLGPRYYSWYFFHRKHGSISETAEPVLWRKHSAAVVARVYKVLDFCSHLQSKILTSSLASLSEGTYGQSRALLYPRWRYIEWRPKSKRWLHFAWEY